MRKRELIAQNFSLFEQLESLRADNAAKDKKIAELEEKVKELTRETDKSSHTTLPLKRLEEKVTNNFKLNPDIEYASEVIGKLVLESANSSNMLTTDGNTEHRELVNLLLGKTEVAKAEILSIVSENIDFDGKKKKIDDVADEAIDYFGSILAQLN